jgi:uncharacterized protein (DUF885 family)
VFIPCRVVHFNQSRAIRGSPSLAPFCRLDAPKDTMAVIRPRPCENEPPMRCLCQRKLLLTLFAILLFLMQMPTALAQDPALTQRFHNLLADEWEYTLREAPTFASHLGDKRYNDRWPDVSLAAIARRHEHQQEVLAKLATIDSQQLSAADRLNYQLFRKEIASDIEQYPFRWFLVPLDQRNGIQTENELADSLSFSTVKDYEDWISRLRAFPKYLDQTVELMRGGIKERIIQPKVVMRRLPEQIKKQIVVDPAESLYSAIPEVPGFAAACRA